MKAVEGKFLQPKITGYRQLSEADAALMNEIKAHGTALGELMAKLRAVKEIDPLWLNAGELDLKVGLMHLTRAVARPTSF